MSRPLRLVLSCFIFYVCTVPVLFCSAYLSSRFTHFTSCPCVLPASLTTCPALISFICPSLSTHLVCLVCVLPALCASSALCQMFQLSPRFCYLWFSGFLITFAWLCLLDLFAWSDCSPVYRTLLAASKDCFYSKVMLLSPTPCVTQSNCLIITIKISMKCSPMFAIVMQCKKIKRKFR